MRKTVLLTMAGLASAACSVDGVASWISMGLAFRTPIFIAYCATLAAAFLAFLLYLRLPLVGLITSWVLPAATHICLVMIDFEMCHYHGCPTTDPYQIAWKALRDNVPLIVLLLVAPVCMLMDYTPVSRAASPRISPP